MLNSVRENEELEFCNFPLKKLGFSAMLLARKEIVRRLLNMKELQRLKPLHAIVARELALGASLLDICNARGLNFSSWRQVVTSELMKQEIVRIQEQVEREVIDEHITDPVAIRIKNAALPAANRLVTEIDNIEDGKPQTRISAATSILEMGGYKQQEQKNVIVLNIGESKLNSLMSLSPLLPQPESIKGTA